MLSATSRLEEQQRTQLLGSLRTDIGSNFVRCRGVNHLVAWRVACDATEARRPEKKLKAKTRARKLQFFAPLVYTGFLPSNPLDSRTYLALIPTHRHVFAMYASMSLSLGLSASSSSCIPWTGESGLSEGSTKVSPSRCLRIATERSMIFDHLSNR